MGAVLLLAREANEENRHALERFAGVFLIVFNKTTFGGCADLILNR